MLVDDHQLYTSAVREALEQDAYRYHGNYLPQILTNPRQWSLTLEILTLKANTLL